MTKLLKIIAVIILYLVNSFGTTAQNKGTGRIFFPKKINTSVFVDPLSGYSVKRNLPEKNNTSANKELVDAVGRSYGGHPIDKYGNILSPSGKKREYNTYFPTRKRTKDAARRGGAITPVMFDEENKDHYHALDKKGDKMHKRPHYRVRRNRF